MKILLYKHFNSLRPADDIGEEALAKIKHGDFVTAEIRRPRNVQFHRLYWGLVSLVWDNSDQDRYPTTDDLHAAIKISAGLRTRIQLPNGETGFIPGSIAFHKMDADEFTSFFDRVCDIIAKHFLPGVTSEELRQEVYSMIGIG